MNWTAGIESIYNKYSISLYKKSILMYEELVQGTYTSLKIQSEEKIKRTKEKNGYDTQQTLAMIELIETNSEDRMLESQSRMIVSFHRITDSSNVTQLLNHYEQVKEEPYFKLLDKLRGNGEVNAFFNIQLKKYELKNMRITPTKPVEKNDDGVSYKQLIIDGAPGTGKSYGIEQEVKEFGINHERVTFYQDYEYHNFVGSILPKLDGNNVIYSFSKGPFTKLLNDAFNNPEDKHYLIIEELTRGNAAAIFGDIFQLLDRDEDGWSMYPITNDNIFNALDRNVQNYLNSTESYNNKVVLPPNFSIICTINSSDQNVYPLDTAFKRRFDYKIKSTEPHSEFKDFDIQFGTMEPISWKSFYQELNKFILRDMKLKEDKQVGPYFIKENDKLTSIQTKLAMYMWNDLQKVHIISSVKIFNESKVQTLYTIDNLFRTGSEEQILNILSKEFKKHFQLEE